MANPETILSEIPTVPKTHCTLVCGWDAANVLVYMRTFDYTNKVEKDNAQTAVKWCIDNCNRWMISDIKQLNIPEE